MKTFQFEIRNTASGENFVIFIKGKTEDLARIKASKTYSRYPYKML